MRIKIIKATSKHIKDLGHLFDLYRQFYKYKSNLKDSVSSVEAFVIVWERENDNGPIAVNQSTPTP